MGLYHIISQNAGRVIQLLLAIALTLGCVSCNVTSSAGDGESSATEIYSSGETSDETPVATAAQTESTAPVGTVKAEINSKSVSDFSEMTDVTSYVKLTVKDHGELVLCLLKDAAPVTVANFQKLVGAGYYNGLTFHRIYKGFMIQGGAGASTDSIKGEFSSNGFSNYLSHIRGIVSMARTVEPNSASSQFFICDADATFLDGNYAAFGYVIAGLETVDAIASVPVQNNGRGELSDPLEDVIIEKACFVTPN